MNSLKIRACVVSSFFLVALGANAYLFEERAQIKDQLQQLEMNIIQKAALLKLASQPHQPSPMGHRLGLPCSRMTVGEDFQRLSQKLKLGRLDFQISPETAIGDTFTESTVDLKFQNAFDQPLFLMMTYLLDDFPGLVYPTEIIMWREPNTQDPLISGHFRFQWLKARDEELEP